MRPRKPLLIAGMLGAAVLAAGVADAQSHASEPEEVVAQLTVGAGESKALLRLAASGRAPHQALLVHEERPEEHTVAQATDPEACASERLRRTRTGDGEWCLVIVNLRAGSQAGRVAGSEFVIDLEVLARHHFVPLPLLAMLCAVILGGIFLGVTRFLLPGLVVRAQIAHLVAVNEDAAADTRIAGLREWVDRSIDRRHLKELRAVVRGLIAAGPGRAQRAREDLSTALDSLRTVAGPFPVVLEAYQCLERPTHVDDLIDEEGNEVQHPAKELTQRTHRAKWLAQRLRRAEDDIDQASSEDAAALRGLYGEIAQRFSAHGLKDAELQRSNERISLLEDRIVEALAQESVRQGQSKRVINMHMAYSLESLWVRSARAILHRVERFGLALTLIAVVWVWGWQLGVVAFAAVGLVGWVALRAPTPSGWKLLWRWPLMDAQRAGRALARVGREIRKQRHRLRAILLTVILASAVTSLGLLVTWLSRYSSNETFGAETHDYLELIAYSAAATVGGGLVAAMELWSRAARRG